MRMEAKLIPLQFAFELPRFFNHTLLTNYFFTEAFSLELHLHFGYLALLEKRYLDGT